MYAYRREGTLEITTCIGCSINCIYCPQQLLLKNYKDSTKILTFDIFKKCIDKVPKKVRIDFAGMSEPYLNKECTKMILYASENGHPISLYTTLVGMTEEDFEQIKDLRYDFFVIHVPDERNNSKIKITQEYLNLLRKVTNYKLDGRVSYSCHAPNVHPTVEKIVMQKSPVSSAMIDRAGNLDQEGLEHRENSGRIACIRSYRSINHNILLPDGSVTLCCMDYGLKHLLGNLLDCSYEDLFNSEEAVRIKRAFDYATIDSLCRTCTDAYSIEEFGYVLNKEIESYKKWTYDLEQGNNWLESQLNNYKEENKKLISWVKELEKGKEWLDNQMKNHKKEIKNLITVNEELKQWSKELEASKKWLEEQVYNKSKENENLCEVNQELSKWVKTLEESKEWIDQERIKCSEELKDAMRKLETTAEELDNQKRKYEYKIKEHNRRLEELKAITNWLKHKFDK